MSKYDLKGAGSKMFDDGTYVLHSLRLVNDNGEYITFSPNEPVKLSISNGLMVKEAKSCSPNAVSIGSNTTASEVDSYAEGVGTTASGYDGAHAEGSYTVASGNGGAHAEGCSTTASGEAGLHAEGYSATASGSFGAHAEGYYTTASGDTGAHAEGSYTVASGTSGAHAEGCSTTAAGLAAHAEGGDEVETSGYGRGTDANGAYSHAEGRGTIAHGEAQHVQGKYNIEDTTNTYAHIVGNGHLDEVEGFVVPSNAHTLDWNGNAWFAGDVTCNNVIIKSSTANSTKLFKITVNDSGALSAVEYTA